MGCVAVALALLGLVGDCDTDDAVLREAAAAFQRGVERGATPEAKQDFQRAAEQFAMLRRHGHDSARLAANEGNASLLAGDVPRAILAYRHGLRLSPGDTELRANLAYARSQVIHPALDDYGRPPVERWPGWLPWPSPTWWLALAMTAYAITCGVFTRWLMTRKRRFLQATLACYVLLSVLAVVVAAEAARLRDVEAHPVVVLARDGLRLRKGNGDSYPPRRDTPLSRGVEARLLFERGAWLQVRLAGGEIGWLPRADVLIDEPAPPCVAPEPN